MPWTAFESSKAVLISGSNGVYEIADHAGSILYIGAATARDLFGLRGCIAAHFAGQQGFENPPVLYRYEVTSAYLSRHMELLGRYLERHGALPPVNRTGDETMPALPRFGRAG